MKRISSLTFLALLWFAPAVFAEQECCWIDVKTGKQVPTVPASGINYGNMVANLDNGGTWHDPGVAVLNEDRKSARNTRTGQNYALEPCPPPGQTATDVLKTIGSSIHVQIGGGGTFGHDEHHHGEDRHRTADKVSTDKTKTHTTSPTTTHKAVTSACKCHPCTCSPCHCQ